MKFSICILLIFTCATTFAQQATRIKGTVHEKKKPFVGVVVTEIGTETKVFTNEKGEFEILVTTPKPVLKFEYMGYITKEIKIRKRKAIKLRMKPFKFWRNHISNNHNLAPLDQPVRIAS